MRPYSFHFMCIAEVLSICSIHPKVHKLHLDSADIHQEISIL